MASLPDLSIPIMLAARLASDSTMLSMTCSGKSRYVEVEFSVSSSVESEASWSAGQQYVLNSLVSLSRAWSAWKRSV